MRSVSVCHNAVCLLLLLCSGSTETAAKHGPGTPLPSDSPQTATSAATETGEYNPNTWTNCPVHDFSMGNKCGRCSIPDPRRWMVDTVHQLASQVPVITEKAGDERGIHVKHNVSRVLSDLIPVGRSTVGLRLCFAEHVVFKEVPTKLEILLSNRYVVRAPSIAGIIFAVLMILRLLGNNSAIGGSIVLATLIGFASASVILVEYLVNSYAEHIFEKVKNFLRCAIDAARVPAFERLNNFTSKVSVRQFTEIYKSMRRI